MLLSFLSSRNKVVLIAAAGAVFVSVIYGLPHILIFNKLKAEGFRYVPITFFSDLDEAQLYAPQIEEVAGGRFFYGDVVLKEYADKNTPIQPLGGIVLGSVARVLGLERTLIAIDFILPAAIFLLFFFIVYLLTGRALITFLFSLIYIFSRDASSLFPFSNLHQFRVFAAYFKPVISLPVETRPSFDRIFTPEWTFIPLSLFFIFWVLALKKEKTSFAVVSGLFYGALFYSYLYDWMVISLVLGFGLSIGFLTRDKILRKVSLLSLGIGLFVSVPFWLNLLDLKSISHYSEIVARSGIEVGRVFRADFLWHYIVWIISALVLWRLGRNRIYYAAAAMFFASFISLNVQILTGFVPQPDHFLRYPLALNLWLAFIISGVFLWEKYKDKLLLYKNYLLFFLFSAALLVAIRNVQLPFSYAEHNFNRYTVSESIDESFKWIRENVERDSVILSPSVVTNTHLLIFTPAKVFVPSSGLITMASDREMVERYIVSAKLFGVPDERIKELFSEEYLRSTKNKEVGPDEVIAFHLFHYELYSREPGTYFRGNELRPLDDLENMVQNVLADWKENSTVLLNKYAVDYIYAGSVEKNTFPFCTEKVFSNKAVNIYKKCYEK